MRHPATACPLCGARSRDPFLEVCGVPIQPNALWDSHDEAVAAPRGDIRLTLCEPCGMIWNAAFDASALEYTADYENSLHFSTAFQRYAEHVADRLIDRYDIRRKTVLEIGSGKGEFLRLVCTRGENRGVGFDPTYAGESDQAAGGRIRFVRELYGEETAPIPADLVVCRHVLEHVDDPLTLLATVRRAVGGGTVVYFEVPAGEHLLHGRGVWDVIYPHVSVFTTRSLRLLFERAGFEILDVGRSFGDQYLWLEAKGRQTSAEPPTGGAGEDLRALAAGFAAALSEKRALWGTQLSRTHGDDVVVWGAGAKGTTFLNLVHGGARAGVVDVNPRKHGKFVPGTGQRIAAPEDLADRPPARVLAMNAMYRDEIADRLHAVGLATPVDTV